MILIDNLFPSYSITSWIKIAEGWILHHCEAGIEPNNLPWSEPGSDQWPWRNQPSRSGIARISKVKTTLTRVSDFLSIDVTETYLRPPCSWHRAQKPSAIGSRIRSVVVEGSTIEFWDCQHTIQHCNFMNKVCGGSILYHCKAGVEANNLPQSDPESVKRS